MWPRAAPGGQTTAAAGTKSDWGFSCLIRDNGKNVQPDTGANPAFYAQT
jgi:hypothetical protein